MLQRKEYSLLHTISRSFPKMESNMTSEEHKAHIKPDPSLSESFDTKSEPKSYMVRDFFRSSFQSSSEVFKIDDSNYKEISSQILEALQKFIEQTEFKLLYIHVEVSQKQDFDMKELITSILNTKTKGNSPFSFTLIYRSGRVTN